MNLVSISPDEKPKKKIEENLGVYENNEITDLLSNPTKNNDLTSSINQDSYAKNKCDKELFTSSKVIRMIIMK